MTWKIPLFRIAWDESDLREVEAVIRSGMSWSSGPAIGEFEAELARYTGTRYAVTFNSGTSALHAALAAHGIGSGDEVIVPSFTFVATANAPLFVGATPVFADIEEETFGLDPEDVREKITDQTKAILPIHYAGCPCRIRELAGIAADHDLILIEDAAEAFGADIGGKKVGTFGDSAMLSFCQNKIIATGEGGAMVTDSRDLAERLKLLRSHGREETGDYFSTCGAMDYVALGYNFRLPTMAAALGLSQLRRVESLLGERRRAADFYRKGIRKNVPECTVPEGPAGYRHVYQMFPIRCRDRDTLSAYLEAEGIMTKVYFPPVHLTRFQREVRGDRSHLPVTEKVAGEILSLPFHPGLPEEDAECVMAAMRRCYDGVSR
ncbi:MAG: DegT/DnrJ/EryC1/StrS family aminotransferase [Methanomicrobiales archaeon]|nr:DegT/DnrJ/EryC1/StrS family aminotransferase [Methanomicrobiales archaeon]